MLGVSSRAERAVCRRFFANPRREPARSAFTPPVGLQARGLPERPETDPRHAERAEGCRTVGLRYRDRIDRQWELRGQAPPRVWFMPAHRGQRTSVPAAAASDSRAIARSTSSACWRMTAAACLRRARCHSMFRPTAPAPSQTVGSTTGFPGSRDTIPDVTCLTSRSQCG